MPLQSQLFRGDPKLEAAAVSDPAHILLGASGPHVSKIQQALIQLDGAVIAQDSAYGPATATAVATFKRKRQILNIEGSRPGRPAAELCRSAAEGTDG
jgi:peptidoglycan hydrolase-like protein with peptidoglycan-binding domain